MVDVVVRMSESVDVRSEKGERDSLRLSWHETRERQRQHNARTRARARCLSSSR
jgi:hypothetical protein